MEYEVGITSGFGIEAVTQRELRALLGIEHAPSCNGMLRFRTSQYGVVMCNMWLRTAERVFIVVHEQAEIDTFDKLFDAVSGVAWQDYLPQDARIHINGKSIDSTLYGVSACQAIAKKAVVVAMQRAYHTHTIAETGVEYNITVSLYKNTLTLLLDTSGQALHKRGYRPLVGEAALKETMAAALLLLSVWNKHKPLIDPFCGSGTIPIEAALMARNIAPGAKRNFACEAWEGWQETWRTVREKASADVDNDAPLRIAGFDINPEAIRLCRTHAERAGVAGDIHFQCLDMREVKSNHPYGVIVTNPPYGERLLTPKQVDALMRDFYRVFTGLPKWSLYMISAYPFVEMAFGKKADKNRKLYNGKIQCRLYQYLGEKPPKTSKA